MLLLSSLSLLFACGVVFLSSSLLAHGMVVLGYGCFQLLQYHLGRHQPHYRIINCQFFHFSKPLFQKIYLLLLWFLLCNLSILSFVFCFSFWLLLCLCNFHIIISSCNNCAVHGNVSSYWFGCLSSCCGVNFLCRYRSIFQHIFKSVCFSRN